MGADTQEMDGVLIMVCDQPRVTVSLLQALVARQQESGLPIVASRYGDIKGTPALFHRSMFPLLLELKGDRGAGKLLADRPEKVATVDFPEGANDIDTMADYERLTKSKV
jgi:molybdenum cofactor cytidylyltransferase